MLDTRISLNCIHNKLLSLSSNLLCINYTSIRSKLAERKLPKKELLFNLFVSRTLNNK